MARVRGLPEVEAKGAAGRGGQTTRRGEPRASEPLQQVPWLELVPASVVDRGGSGLFGLGRSGDP